MPYVCLTFLFFQKIEQTMTKQQSLRRFAALPLLWILLCSHEFWMAPARYRVAPGESVRVALWVGENFEGEPWEAGSSRVARLADRSGGREQNLLGLLKNDRLDSLFVPFERAGTHPLVLATTFKFIELEAEKFNAYLEEDGLDVAQQTRQQRGETQKPGRERYCRNAKTLVQVGDKTTRCPLRRAGLPLEITPLQNPYRLAPGARIVYEIRFAGKPLAGLKVRHWNKPGLGGNNLVEMKQSDALGRVEFDLKAGETLISTVHMRECPDRAAADWESYWGSLTFSR
jgi:uncharacterized GH25 family protein